MTERQRMFDEELALVPRGHCNNHRLPKVASHGRSTNDKMTRRPEIGGFLPLRLAAIREHSEAHGEAGADRRRPQWKIDQAVDQDSGRGDRRSAGVRSRLPTSPNSKDG